MITISTKGNLSVIVMQNGYIRLVVIPELGGKIVEFASRSSGRQFLLEYPDNIISHKLPTYGESFSEERAYGWDECFPTIEPSVYPEHLGKDSNVEFPDHGELWSRRWRYDINGDELVLESSGVRKPYILRKTMRLLEGKVVVDYALKNSSDSTLNYLWSAHPLLKVDAGDRIILPRSVRNVFVNWASDPRLGEFGNVLAWPLVADGRDYSYVQDSAIGTAVKCYSEPLSEGFAAVYSAAADETIAFRFDPAEIPYLGIWLSYGGWPVGAEKKQLTVGIEPATGRPDSLSRAIASRECATIGGGEERRWSLSVEISPKICLV